jgi:hypothetical protein
LVFNDEFSIAFKNPLWIAPLSPLESSFSAALIERRYRALVREFPDTKSLFYPTVRFAGCLVNLQVNDRTRGDEFERQITNRPGRS